MYPHLSLWLRNFDAVDRTLVKRVQFPTAEQFKGVFKNKNNAMQKNLGFGSEKMGAQPVGFRVLYSDRDLTQGLVITSSTQPFTLISR